LVNDDGFEFRVRKSKRLEEKEVAASTAFVATAGPTLASSPRSKPKTKSRVQTVVTTSPRTRPTAKKIPPLAPDPNPVEKQEEDIRLRRKRDKAVQQDDALKAKNLKPGRRKVTASVVVDEGSNRHQIEQSKPLVIKRDANIEKSTHKATNDSISSRIVYSSDVSTIKLPTSDTPINEKNQQFRLEGGGGRRRSSLGMRGRRGSSMMIVGITGTKATLFTYQD
jgi:hypothetical protein